MVRWSTKHGVIKFMKAERTHDYVIRDFGRISFLKRDAGNGSAIYRVVWASALDAEAYRGTAIGWLQPGQKPTAELAEFWCKVACAIDDGLADRYHYHDKHIDPPKRDGAKEAA